jgi:uncharacterized membrane protein SpoIIM required for sporulation
LKQHTFEQLHQPQWQQLEQWLDKADKRDQESRKESVTFPQLYRQVCQHLALARDRHYTPHLIERLNRLVLRGHQYLYTSRAGLLAEVVSFIGQTFPQKVRQEVQLVTLSCTLFFGSMFTMFTAILIYPDLVFYLLDVEQVLEFEKMYSPTAEHLGRNREANSDFLMFGYYIYNNISIGFQTFASGILFGLGSLFFLLINGIILGCVAGHLTHIGYTVPFYSFVAGHSAPELIAIALSGAAGLRIGKALVSPGRLSRLQALRSAATDSMYLVYGVIFLLLIAAFIEAFWSSNSAIAPFIKYTVGLSLWIILTTYLVSVGRRGT